MKIKVDDAGPCRKQVQIEVPAETVDAEYKALLAAFSSHAKVPGFRPGRAPKEMIERRYRKDILVELRDRVVPTAYHEAIASEKLDVVALADFKEPVEVVPGKPVVFTVVVDVPPSFELPPYKGIALKAGDVAISDEAVQQAVDTLRSQAAKYEEITGRAAQAKDLAQVEFAGTIDGKPVDEAVPEAKGLGQAKGLWVAVGDESFPPGVGEALTGAAIGDTREVDSTFPEGTTVKALAGRTVHYRVTVTALRQPILPELDEVFCTRMGAATPEELRAKIRAELESGARSRDEGRQRDEIARHLLASTPMELPATLVQRETEQLVYDIVRENARRGIKQDAIVGQKAQIFEAANRNASDSIKMRYILHKIAEAEKIEATDDDVSAQIASMAKRYNVPPEEMLAGVKKRNGLDNLREQVRTDKTMSFLVQQAKVG